MSAKRSTRRTGSRPIPRSDCSYLPGGTPRPGSRRRPRDRQRRPAARRGGRGGADLAVRSRAWNDGKVTAHHAIIPTPKASLGQPLSNDERNVYNLIARRYLAQFYPPHEFYQLEAELHVAGERFIAKGRQPIAPGWRRLYDSPADREDADGKDPDAPPRDDDVDPHSPIPPLKPGQVLRIAKTRTVEKKTKPPRGSPLRASCRP